MAFYDKLLRLTFVAIIILITYLFIDDDRLNLENNQEKLIPFPDFPIKKIDVGQGEDVWILTDTDKLYHWSTILHSFVIKQENVLDFAVGKEGTVVCVCGNNEIFIRNLNTNWWYRIDDGRYTHQTISICDYNKILTTNGNNDLIVGFYDASYPENIDTYNWTIIDSYYTYYQVSCAFLDDSLWIRGSFLLAYRYINKHKHIPRSEAPFKQIKALSEQRAIGIDYDNRLWEYNHGIWAWKRNDVKSASINYDASKPSNRDFSPNSPPFNHLAPQKHNIINHLSKAIHKTFSEQREHRESQSLKGSLLFEEALGLKLNWNKDLLSDLLLRFKTSHEIKKKSLELGLPPHKFKKVIKQFADEVWNNKLQRCKTEDLRAAYDANGKEGVKKALTSEFLEYIPEYLEEQDKEKYHSLKQLSDLSFPAEWHPAARTMQRKIIMHVGPTNSGKTYNALKCLEKSESGIYCGPLRLLAHEIFDRMNTKSIPCNLVTGEERRELKGCDVRLTSSTIEMANLNSQLDVAVIDEIQMISDQQRGWAWTQALLGLQAKEIHLCGEASAVKLVKSVCASLNEDVEVREYRRLSKLVVADESLNGDLGKIQKGDCVVTFSRKAIFGLKNEIEQVTGLRCAVVYGALPPETRAMQAKLFNDPNSGYDVLIASDAVGMGLNLNIRRIIFETVKKFDGKEIRYISIPQIKQIAGRAGRYGFDNPIGEVTALESQDMRYVQKAMQTPSIELEVAGLQPTMEMVEQFAHQLSGIEQFEKLLEKFEDLARVDGQFFLCNFDSQKIIAKSIEHVDLTIPERFIFATSPINSSDPKLMLVIKKLAKYHSDRIPVSLGSILHLDAKVPRDIQTLSYIESKHRIIMLYLWLSYRFPETFLNIEEALEMKTRCEALIHESLQSLKFSRNRHRITKSDVKKMNKTFNQSQEKQLAREHKSKYPNRIRNYEKRTEEKLRKNEDKLRKVLQRFLGLEIFDYLSPSITSLCLLFRGHFWDVSPIPLPFIGNLHQIGIRFDKFANGQTSKHGDFWEFFIGNQRNVVISRPNLIKELCKENNSINYFTKYKDIKLDSMNIIINYGVIFNNNYEKWKYYRKFFEKSVCSMRFLRGLTKSIQHIFNEVELNWNKQLQQRQQQGINDDLISLDLSVWSRYFLTDIILSTSTKNSSNYLPGFKGLSETFKRNNNWLFYNLLEIIKQRRNEIALLKEKEPIDSSDLLDILLTINTTRDPNGFDENSDKNDKSNKSMSDNEILAIILDIDIGGRDPTASTFCFTVYNICKHPKVLQEFREEIVEVLGTDFLRPIKFEDLSKFKYLEAIIKEAQRIIPLNPLIPLQSHNKIILNGHIIEKDTPIWLHQEKLHKDENSWHESERFIPERFLNNGLGNNIFIPWCEGIIRNCPGKNMAMIILKCLLILLFRKYNIELVDKVSPAKVMYF
ncbi:16117_t:CDS:10, partial [Funneliformis geosporum]